MHKKTGMVTVLTATFSMIASSAFAGEIERRGDPSMILFEEGRNYAEFSAVRVMPSVSGQPRPGLPGGPTGDIQKSYLSLAGGYKHDLNDRVTLAFVIDQPVGVNVDYRTPPAALGGAFFGTSNAELDSIAYTALLRYKATDRFSVYGGLRYMGISGNIEVLAPAILGSQIPAPNQPYNLSVNKDFQFGYLLGAAYEIPDIALRVALTYESKTKHKFKDNTGSNFTVEIPQASRCMRRQVSLPTHCFSARSNGANGASSTWRRMISFRWPAECRSMSRSREVQMISGLMSWGSGGASTKTGAVPSFSAMRTKRVIW
jgi:long-subunit fatty acid transport protein